jgi:hypothetical protein
MAAQSFGNRNPAQKHLHLVLDLLDGLHPKTHHARGRKIFRISHISVQQMAEKSFRHSGLQFEPVVKEAGKTVSFQVVKRPPPSVDNNDLD